MTTHSDSLEDDITPFSHPLDSVEDVLNANNWTFNRMNDDELIVQVMGRTGEYRLFFIWQEHLQALQFCAQYGLHVTDTNMGPARRALSSINERLWMGHLDLPSDTGTPTYRYTALFRGVGRAGAMETIEDMVDISMSQCERYFPLFSLLAGQTAINDQHLALALMETAGES